MNNKESSESSSAYDQPEKELNPQQRREKLRDPTYLPTRKDFFCAFESETQPGELDDQEFTSFCFNKENCVYEVLNKEFIESLGNYIFRRVNELGATKDEPLTIIEIGAGNGRLTHFLKAQLEQVVPGKVTMIATDSVKWGIKTDFPVEKLDHQVAIEKYRPKIVICSWMTQEKDLSADFRLAKNVEEYILIGCDEVCGGKWETWGIPPWGEEEKEEYKIPPYQVDGFEREDLDDVRKNQICRMDWIGRDFTASKTVSFKRIKR
jgi:hypothetical protein